MSEDVSSTNNTSTTTSSGSSQTSSQQQASRLPVEMDNTHAAHSLLSMSSGHLVKESAETVQSVPQQSYSGHSTAPGPVLNPSSNETEEESTQLSIHDQMVMEMDISKSVVTKELSSDETVPTTRATADIGTTDCETVPGDLAVLTRQVESNSVSPVVTPNLKTDKKQHHLADQPVSSSGFCSVISTKSCVNSLGSTVPVDSWTKKLVTQSSSVPCTVTDPKEIESDVGQSLGRSQVSSYQVDRNKSTLDYSFTDSDDSSNDPEKSKNTEDGFFQITFDSEDSRSSSNHSEFLTCSVCGKELPETAVDEGGKEMCNTCKLVRTDPEEPKVKRGRKKANTALTEKNVIHVKKSPNKPAVSSEESQMSLTPVRKSTRKRISTIVIEEVIQETEDEEDSDAMDDSNQDADYKHMERKSRLGEKKERKGKSEEEMSKSKYAQELNLTPVIKSDPDGDQNVAKPVSSVPDGVDGDVEEILTNATKSEKVKRKKGRPKGSKNRPKMSKEFTGIVKEPKRDMKFNKRWHRGRGPVPDANPDATDGMWSCEFCGKAFPIRRNFLAHRRKHSGRHKCDECSETFECNSKLQRHIRRHRGEKPFACHICPKAYSENMWLQRHLATHMAEGHAPQPKPYQCNICGRQYTHKGTMIYHVKTHTETKFYQCDVCGKQFTHRSSLECHIKTHTGEKPYVCEVCGKRFADRSVQLRHTRSHSGDKPYKCTICDKGFTQSGTLNIHMRMHTSEKPYKCKVCDMGFMKRCDLSRHSKCHVGEMLSKQANLITCRVNEGRGADIQKKAAQILIDAYGEKKEDGTIEIKTRQFEQPVESEETEEVPQHVSGGQISSLVKAMELHADVDPHQMDVHLMGRPEQQMPEHHQLQHEEIQRRAMEYIIMKRQELEQQGMERMSVLHQSIDRSSVDHVPIDRHVIEHQTVEVVTEQHPADRQIVEQQIERHVEQHAAQRQLLEQVEGHVLEGQQQVIEEQQIDHQRLEQMSPQQQAIWICKY